MNKYILIFILSTLINVDSYLIYNNETINTFSNITLPNICGELINYDDTLYLSNSSNINSSNINILLVLAKIVLCVV